MKLKKDDWLGSMLESDAFQVEIDDRATPASLQELFNDAPPGFYFSKVPTRNVPLLDELARHGFRVIDVSVTLERKPAAPQEFEDIPAVVVRDVDPKIHAGIADIAEQCFVYSRFHLDPRVPAKFANRIKRMWVENSMHGKRGNGVLVAEWKSQVAGFLTVVDRVENERKVRIIDLVGVGRDFQGRGVGRALVQQFIRRATPDIETLRVGTQAANIPSLRLYESTGFQIVDTKYVLHAHR